MVQTAPNDILLNGHRMPRYEASISIDDRGWRHGDGVFETMLIRNGIPYLWEQHIRRMGKCLEALKISYHPGSLYHPCLDLIAHNKMYSGLLRILISRGAGGQGYLPAPPGPHGYQCTVFVETSPLPPPVKLEEQRICLSGWQKPSPKSLPSQAKLMQGLNSTLVRMEAAEHNCVDALMLSVDKKVCECSSANIFWYKRKVMFTPSLETGCLPGTIRERLIEISEYGLKTGEFPLRALLQADAVILTNSSRIVVPIHEIEGFATKWKASDKLARIFEMRFEQDIADYIEQRKHLVPQGAFG